MPSFLIILFTVVILAAGTALAYTTGAVAVLVYYASGLQDYLALSPQLVFSQIDVFALMAMPLFMLVGEIMNRGKVTQALVDFAVIAAGRTRGALGHVNILTSVFFAGISGSAMADSAALGNTLVPAMVNKGYDKVYAGAITAASSIIGPIIPPSIILIFYGAIMRVDVAALFAAGVLPGLILAGALMIANGYFAIRHNHPRGERLTRGEALGAAKRALPALVLPLIIVVGIVLGFMTPTEAAAVAVFAAVIVSAIYKTLSAKVLFESFKRTVVLTGAIFILFAAASLVIYIAALTEFPSAIANSVVEIGLTGNSYIVLIVVVFILFGMVLDTLLGLALVAPVLVPVAISQGADPVHMGICVCLTLTVGLISPPLGGSVLVVSAVTDTPYWSLFRWVTPFLLVEIAFLFLIALVPEITLFLPRLLGL